MAGVDLLCMLFVDIKLAQSVPSYFKEVWSRASTTVYTWIFNSEQDTPQRDNTLFWELLLHRMLLHKSPLNSKSGSDSMAARFKAFTLDDYQFLVSSLESIYKKVGVKQT